MKITATIRWFILAVFIFPAIAWLLLSWYEKKIERLPVLGKSPSHRIADFSFINQDAETITADKWDNKIVVANFFFTHCPVICPKMTKSLARVTETYADEVLLQFASFTVDPERDNAETLKRYAGRFALNTQKWDLLTGDKRELYNMARNSFMLVATDGDGGPDDFIHSENLVLIDRQKRIRGYYNGTSKSEVDQLITDIKKLKHED